MRHISERVFRIIRNVQRVRHLSTTKSCLREPVYDASGKTTAIILNLMNKETVLINACDEHGFSLNNDTVAIGPIAAFPRTILSWNVGCARDINEASLSLFLTLEPKVELLVLGLEKKYDFEEFSRLKNLLRKAEIPSEILPVKQAIGIFNFASCEGRYVVGGFIPPLEEESTALITDYRTT